LYRDGGELGGKARGTATCGLGAGEVDRRLALGVPRDVGPVEDVPVLGRQEQPQHALPGLLVRGMSHDADEPGVERVVALREFEHKTARHHLLTDRVRKLGN
jgi:hypothetical protein